MVYKLAVGMSSCLYRVEILFHDWPGDFSTNPVSQKWHAISDHLIHLGSRETQSCFPTSSLKWENPSGWCGDGWHLSGSWKQNETSHTGVCRRALSVAHFQPVSCTVASPASPERESIQTNEEKPGYCVKMHQSVADTFLSKQRLYFAFSRSLPRPTQTPASLPAMTGQAHFHSLLSRPASLQAPPSLSLAWSLFLPESQG